MGDHLRNPVAIANAKPKRPVACLELGGGMGLIGFEIHPVPTEHEGKPAIMATLVAIGGKVSELYPMEPVVVPICPLGGVPLDILRSRFAEACGVSLEPEVAAPGIVVSQ